MRQLLQHLDSGRTALEETPAPSPAPASLVVENRASVVSAGTERMLVEFGRAGLLEKARRQPERVREVLEKVRTDGLLPTVEAVRGRLASPLALGYASAGVVREVGAGVRGFSVGDRVATNGAHAEVVRVPWTLAARIPDGVSFREAAFTPLGAIALQGLRNARPTLGETVVVYGLGLVGLLTAQLARAQGLRVLGIDLLEDRLALARELGAEPVEGHGDPVAAVLTRTGGMGADAVLLTLDASSDEPVHRAAEMSRKRGRLVLVGVTGLELRRSDFYEKELSFTVSSSYGPGRYDPAYEEEGRDYPLAHVRWTAGRNFGAFLRLVDEGAVTLEPLVTHRFPFERAAEAYDLLTGETPSLGIVLEYEAVQGSENARARRSVEVAVRRAASTVPGTPVAGVIGAGSFARGVLLPLLADLPVRLHTVCASSGTGAGVAARRFGFERAVSDPDVLLSDPGIDTVFVLTRHDSHAELAARALEAGKHVFVEKPLALTLEELRPLRTALERAPGLLTVGFNRRFAPTTLRLRDRLASRAGPLALQLTVNAGRLPGDHWLLDGRVGGGRLVGEGCHFVDLARYLVACPLSGFDLRGEGAGQGRAGNDPWHLGLSFEDGSVATVHYLPTGSRRYPKERIEAFVDGTTFVLDNFRRLRSYGAGPRFSFPRGQDKGHRAELEAWLEAVRETGTPPIPYSELFEVAELTLEASGRRA